jgi:hypothetical protein
MAGGERRDVVTPLDMTGDSMMSTAAAAAAIAAEMQRREEEEMTPHGSADLSDGWEFKILRANSAAFRNPARFRAILGEEARGGWVLVEKFHDYRVRLKRPASAKDIPGDIADGYDPYRTTVGVSQGKIMAVVLAAALVVVGGLVLLAFMIG